MTQESFRHKGLRKGLIETLQKKGIKNAKVLNAINSVQRHRFLDEAFSEWAYKDQAFQIACDQTISQPYTVARQTELLELKDTDVVLEIGTGSGYQACVLALLCKKVYTIERHKFLFEKTAQLLIDLGFGSIRTLFGDGYKGSPRFAPFDKIIVTAAAPNIPETLCQQLKIGGYLVVPVGKDEVQKMVRVTRTAQNEFKEEIFGNYKFVPFLKGVN